MVENSCLDGVHEGANDSVLVGSLDAIHPRIVESEVDASKRRPSVPHMSSLLVSSCLHLGMAGCLRTSLEIHELI